MGIDRKAYFSTPVLNLINLGGLIHPIVPTVWGSPCQHAFPRVASLINPTRLGLTISIESWVSLGLHASLINPWVVCLLIIPGALVSHNAHALINPGAVGLLIIVLAWESLSLHTPRVLLY